MVHCGNAVLEFPIKQDFFIWNFWFDFDISFNVVLVKCLILGSFNNIIIYLLLIPDQQNGEVEVN